MAQKSFQVLKLSNRGVSYLVIKHPGESNPYRLYESYYDYNRYNQPTKRRKLIQKYCDLASCLNCIIGKAWEGGKYADCMYAD